MCSLAEDTRLLGKYEKLVRKYRRETSIVQKERREIGENSSYSFYYNEIVYQQSYPEVVLVTYT